MATAKRQHPYPPLKGSLKYELRERDVKFVINSQNKMIIALCWIRFKKTYIHEFGYCRSKPVPING